MDLCGDCWKVLVGDVLARLGELPERHFHAVVTSPPFWALRSYLPKDHPDKHLELGSEKTPEEYVANMVKVFAGVKRVLRDDGVCWMELGDSYSAAGWECRRRSQIGSGSMATDERKPNGHSGIAEGNQLLMPHRVALALQADGWIVRQTVVWHRRSPMPESINGTRWVRCRVKVKGQGVSVNHAASATEPRHCRPGPPHPDNGLVREAAQYTACPGCPKCLPNGGYVLKRGSWRHTTAHSYVFMLTKKMGYFSDAEAGKEKALNTGNSRGSKRTPPSENAGVGHQGWAGYMNQDGKLSGRNPRSVLTLATEPFKEAHFATFPATLVYKLLKPVVSRKGCCPVCGEPWAPVVESRFHKTQETNNAAKTEACRDNNRDVTKNPRGVNASRVLSYRPTCECGHKETVPCRVADIFAGSGTVGQVCQYLGADFTGIELNPEYAEMAAKRIQTPWKPKHKRKTTSGVKECQGQRKLF